MIMEKVNIVYADYFDEVDIIGVPDELIEKLDGILERFYKWLDNPENLNMFSVDDERWGRVLKLDTEAILWWINNHEISGETEAMLLDSRVLYCPEYPSLEL